MGRRPRVAIVFPAYDRVPANFAYDLASMTAFLGAQALGEPGKPGLLDNFNLTTVTGTYIHTAREELAEHGLASGADYLLWIDADMRFPRDALLRLMAHDKDIVGINYSKRGVPPDFVAIKRRGGDGEPAEKLVTAEDSTGLEEVEALGFGLVLMKAKVFADLERPWFWCDYLEPGRQVGEDVRFCQMVRDQGFEVYVDHALSKECRHIGEFEYAPDHAAAMLEPDLALVED